VSNLQLRMITGIFLGMLALVASWVGGYVFTAFALIVGAALYYEWQTLTHMHQTKMLRLIGWCFYGVVIFLLLSSQTAEVIFTTILVAVLVLSLLSQRSRNWIAGGFIYAVVAPVALVLIRGDNSIGFAMLMFLYAVVWGTDSAAYFSGKAIGGAKLIPKISPNKTWSGAIGGTLIGIVLGLFVLALLLDFHLFDFGFRSFIILVLAFILSLVSQLGDMGESWMKRHFNVKDSSNLLPGHGGFMDRLDGLIVASIVFYIIAALFGDMNRPSVFFKFL